MADGSRTVEIEADAAAAEAAREAKAEVLERAAKVESADTLPPPRRWARRRPTRPARNRSGPSSSSTSGSPTFNSVEFGIYKHSRNRAKSRQFTSDMDIFAEMIEDGERTGLLGYREDLWRKNTGMDKRLVFKLFNETVNWRATMDLMIGRSLQLTLGARGLPVTCFSINVGDHDQHGLPGALGQQVAARCRRTSRSSCWRTASRSSTGCGATSSISAATTRSTITATRRSAGSTARCSRSAASGRARVKAEHADPRLHDRAQAVLRHADLQRRLPPPHAHAGARGRRRQATTPKLEKQEADLYMNPAARGEVGLMSAAMPTVGRDGDRLRSYRRPEQR